MNFRIFYSYLFFPLFGFSSNFQSDLFNNNSAIPQQVQQNVQNETSAHTQLDSEINPEACIEIDKLPLLCQSGNIDIHRTYKINAALDVVETMLQQNTPSLSRICCAAVQQKDEAVYVQFIEASLGSQPKLHRNISPSVSVIVFNNQCTKSTLRNLPSVKLLFANTVTKICQNQFQECKNLYKVIIPFTVTEIGELAFYHSFVHEVEIVPRNFSLSTNLFGLQMTPPVIIQKGAFNFCPQLTKVNIHSVVIIMHEEAFANCQQLSDVCLPLLSGVPLPEEPNLETLNNIEAKIFSGSNVSNITFEIPDMPLANFLDIHRVVLSFGSILVINRVASSSTPPKITLQKILDLPKKINIDAIFQEKHLQENPSNLSISLPFKLDNPGSVFKFLVDFFFDIREKEGEIVPKTTRQIFPSAELAQFLINSLFMDPAKLSEICKNDANWESLIWFSQALRAVISGADPSVAILPSLRKLNIVGIGEFLDCIRNFENISILRALMNDDIDKFQEIISRTNTKINEKMVILATFFHANNIVKYAIFQGFNIKLPQIFMSAVLSNNTDCMHYSDNSGNLLFQQILPFYLRMAVYGSSEILQFLLDQLTIRNSDLQKNIFFFNGMSFDQPKLLAVLSQVCFLQYLEPKVFDNFVITFESNKTEAVNQEQIAADGQADDNAAENQATKDPEDHSSCRLVVRYFSKKLTEDDAQDMLENIQNAIEKAQDCNINVTDITINVHNETEISDDAQNLLRGINLDDENSNEPKILSITIQTMDASKLTLEKEFSELFQ